MAGSGVFLQASKRCWKLTHVLNEFLKIRRIKKNIIKQNAMQEKSHIVFVQYKVFCVFQLTDTLKRRFFTFYL